MATTGAKAPTVASTTAEAPWSDDAWVSPANIYGAGEASVTAATFDAGDQTEVLKAYTFDMSAIPAGATINGVICVINARYATAPASLDLVQLLDASRAKVGTNLAATPTALTTSAANYTFGSSSDVWGNSLTAAWVKDADFGVAIGALAGGTGNNNVDVYIDSVTLEVYYTPVHNATATLAGTSSVVSVGKIVLSFTATLAGTSSAVITGKTGSTHNATATLAGTSSLLVRYQGAFILSASSYISASGENTTAQLTPPSGKTIGDFETGRIADDENPLDAINLTVDKYTEVEWSIAPTVVANTDTWEFRVTVAGVAIDTYSVIPTLTVTQGTTHNVTATLAGTSSVVSVGKRSFAYTATLAGTSSVVSVGNRSFAYTATLAGTSSVVSVGNRSFAFISTLAGTSSAVSVGKNSFAFTTTLSGTSTLVGFGQLTGQVDFRAILASTSSMVSVGKNSYPISAAIAGTSVLSVAGKRSFGYTATISGTSALTIAGYNSFSMTVLLAGTSSVTVFYSDETVLGMAYLSDRLIDTAALSDTTIWSAVLVNSAYESAELDDEPQ